MYKYREFKVGNNLNSQIILPIHEFNGTKEGLVLGIIALFMEMKHSQLFF